MKGINHYIITRFNIKIDAFKKDKNNNSVKDEQYLNERFALFEKYCFPSIQNQTNKNFRWLVYFDIDTPQYFKEKINELERRFSNFEPYYVSNYNDFITHYQSVCYSSVNSATNEKIICTRLDNDDAILSEHVDTIQKYVRDNNIQMGVVDFYVGLIYDTQKRILIKCNIKSHHFISIVDTDRKQAVKLYWNHSMLKESKPYYPINTKIPMWLEISHGTNILNDINNVKRGSVVFKDKYTNMNISISLISSIIRIAQTLIYLLKYRILRPLAVFLKILSPLEQTV